MIPKKKKAPPPRSRKPANSGEDEQPRRKWSMSNPKVRLNNNNKMVLFDQPTYDKLHFKAPKFILVTPAILSDYLQITGSLARRAIKDLKARGSIKMLTVHASQQMYTRSTNI